MPGVVEALKRLRGVRHIEWLLLALILAAGVLIMGGRGTGGAERTALEERMESVLSCVAGAGKVRVLVSTGEEQVGGGEAVTGVVVVAQGAEDLRVVIGLEQAVQALLGIDAGRIEILSMEDHRP